MPADAGTVEHVTGSKIVVGTGLVYALIVLAIFPRWTVDDAYITFRYARNWAQFGELTWNVGLDPVEGYTGVLLPLLLGLTMKAKLSPIVVSQVLGVVSFLIGGLLLWLLLQRLGVSDAPLSLVIALYLTMPAAFTHAFGGLETMLFAALLLASVYLFAIVLKSPALSPLLCVSLLAMSLTRPEGIILAVLVGAALALRYRRAWLVLFGLLYVLPGLVYFVWRWSYYGQFLPNTFYVKAAHGLRFGSAVMLAKFAIAYLALPGVAVLISGVRLRRSWLWGMTFAFVSVVFAFYLASDLLMNYSHRFFVPFYPLLLALAIWLTGHRRRAWVLVLLVAQLAVHVGLLSNEIDFARRYRQLLADEHMQAGEFVRSSVPASEWLAVVIDAGAIPWLSDLPTLDVGGLNDEALARGADAAERFYGIRPGAAVFTSRAWDHLEASVQPGRAIAGDVRFGDYVLMQRFRSAARDGYYLFVYVRRDLVRNPGG